MYYQAFAISKYEFIDTPNDFNRVECQGAFEELLSVMQEELPKKNTWKGYHLLAIDGMEGFKMETARLSVGRLERSAIE